MKKEYIKTISKKAFDKLSKKEKRIRVAQDVIDRISLSQLTPRAGNFCIFNEIPLEVEKEEKLSERLKSLELKCTVCAKGGLFLSYIGIVNNYNTSPLATNLYGESIQSDEMKQLMEVFDAKQLAMIETAFERSYFSWNAPLSYYEIQDCKDFGYRFDNSSQRLIGICENIIKYGKFNPNKNNNGK